jgi:hypothetical protein
LLVSHPVRPHGVGGLRTNDVETYVCEILWNKGQVNALEPMTIWLQRRVFLWQRWCDHRGVVSGPHLMNQLAEVDVDTPADIVPVSARIPEFNWLWRFVGVSFDDP